MSVTTLSATATPPEWVAECAVLHERIAQLEHKLAWFQRQLFGEKSERRHIEPEAVASALARIGELYACEEYIRDHCLTGQSKRDYRLRHAKLVVDAFSDWAEKQIQHVALLSSNPLTKALHYALERRESLSVYLCDP